MFVEPPAVCDAVVSVAAARNVGSAIMVLDQLTDPVGVVGIVGDDVGGGRQCIEQQLGHGLIVGLAGLQLHVHWQAVADDPGMELAGQSSAASTDTSASSLFFWAAAC